MEEWVCEGCARIVPKVKKWLPPWFYRGHEEEREFNKQAATGRPRRSQEDGRRARDDALNRVDANADPVWKSRALQAIKQVATRQQRLTSDDIWALIEAPREPRALGAVFQTARREGIIKATQAWVQSKRPVDHARDIRIWESCIYGKSKVVARHAPIHSDIETIPIQGGLL